MNQPSFCPVYRSINKPLTIWGAERRLFFLAAVMGAATFNFFASLLGGLVMFAALYLLARWATVTDPEVLRILLNASKLKTHYDPAKRDPAQAGVTGVIRLSRIIKDYEQSGALNARVGVTAAVDERTFLTRSGDLVTMLRVQDADYECLDTPELDHIARRFESALRTFDEQFRIYQYVLKRDHASIPARTYENLVVQEAVASRIAYLQERPENLYSLEIYFAMVYEGLKSSRIASRTLSDLAHRPLSGWREALSSERETARLEEDLKRASEVLAHKVMSFVIQLPETLGADVLDKDRAFHFLRRLLNYAPHKADDVRLKYDDFVDFQACDSALECHRDHLRLDEYYVSVLTLKEPPGRTFAHLLRGLQEIPCNFVIASEWKRESNQKMLSRISFQAPALP